MRAIKQLVLSVAAFIAVTDISLAQTFSITPHNTVQFTGLLEHLQTLSIQQLNTSPDTIILKWKKVSESVPPNWDAAVCDNSICNNSLVDSGRMNPVFPNNIGLLVIHITPHINAGTAIVRYAVWDIANPAIKDTLTYIHTVNASSGISETENKNEFLLFPNPSKQSIIILSNLQTGFQFFITDEAGKEIERGVSKAPSFSVSTEGLANGVYHVSFFEENKKVSTKKFVVQH